MIEDCSKEEVREIDACEILDKIQRGEPANYRCVIVKGDLDLGKVKMPMQLVERTEFEKNMREIEEEAKIVNSSISIRHSKFEGLVNFENAIFKDSVILENSNLGSPSFIGSKFMRFVSFDDSDIGNINFNGVEFWESVTFMNCKIFHADFEGSRFHDRAYFKGLDYNANFDKVRFDGKVDLDGVRDFGRLWKAFEGDSTELEALMGVIYNSNVLIHKEMQEIKKSLEDIKELLQIISISVERL